MKIKKQDKERLNKLMLGDRTKREITEQVKHEIYRILKNEAIEQEAKERELKEKQKEIHETNLIIFLVFFTFILFLALITLIAIYVKNENLGFFMVFLLLVFVISLSKLSYMIGES